MTIESKQAYSYQIACEEGSIRAAAERLSMEPSSVSRHIKSLERSLAMELIERSRSGVHPTEAGKILLHYLRQQKSELEAVLSEFDALRGMRRGEIIVALGDGFIGDFVGNALAEFRQAFPGFKFCLQSGSTDQVMHSIRTDQAHIGFAFNAPPDGSIRSLAKYLQPLRLLASPRSEWADLSSPISLATLTQLPCALLMHGFGVGAMIRDVERIYGLKFNSVVEANSLATLKSYVREGIGVTILPAFVVTREIADNTIMTKPVAIPEFRKGEASLFVRSGRRLPEGVVHLVNQATKSMTAFKALS